MNERETMINFLLQACDQKNAVITDLQKKVADLEKKLAELVPATEPTPGPIPISG